MTAQPVGPTPRPATRVLSPAFVLCAAILIASALGLRPGLSALATAFAKEPIGLRAPLSTFDVAALPSFQKCLDPQGPQPVIADVGAAELALLDLEERAPQSDLVRITLFVTYYSDPRDKVPHTPEVCYRQAGVIVEGVTTSTLLVPDSPPDRRELTLRTMQLQHGRASAVLSYVFCANGEFCHDRQMVRWILGRPGPKRAYFSKIEAVAYCERGADLTYAAQTGRRLLAEAIPLLLEKHFPDSAGLYAD